VSEEFVLREVDISRDAEKLAKMYRASDDQWPGTWSGGAEITPQMVTEWYEREKMINHYIFETDHEIVAYCSFNERQEDKNVGYVALLNVAPEYQGRSLGRRLLQKCLERCSELGFHLLTLGTWSGNLKSVPLYKKTGFFWMPDTSVWMFNFVPSILNLPCAQPYFARHDWYKTFKRELAQAEDDERWEDMKVFTYRWEADGSALTAWADREARRLTAVETDAFFAGAIADNIEPAKGMSTKIRWRLENKQDRPMSISLIASGTEHIKIDHRTTITVAPGETEEIEATVDIAADTPDVKSGKPVPAVRTLLIIDGEVLELGTGLRPQPAIAVSTHPVCVTLFPGVPKRVHLQLHSHLRSDTEATVSLSPPPGLTTDWTESKVEVPSKGFAGLPVTMQAANGGVYALHATVFVQGGKTSPERLAIFCLPAGGVLADQGPKETRIENEWTRLILRPRGGVMALRSSQTNAGLGVFVERVGPPFWPSELQDKDYAISVERTGTHFRAVMTADMEDLSELTVCREVTLGGGPLVQISNSLTNHGSKTHQVQLARNVRRLPEEGATITVPLKGGIVQSRRSEFPRADEDIDKSPEAFAEKWVTLSSKEGTVGIIWEDTIAENEIGWGTSFLTPQLTCGPQQWVDAGKFYLYVGPGDWRTVRQHARRLAGTDSKAEPIPVKSRRVHDARFDPTPLITVDDRITATCVVDNLRARPLEGLAKIDLPRGLAADQGSFEIKDVSAKASTRQAITVDLAPEAAAYEGGITLQTRLFDTRLSVPVIRLGNRRKVAVAKARSNGQSVYTIDNGRTRFTVAPGFTGALTMWQEGDANHVLSPFPEQKTFGWMSPWFGGVTPLAMKPNSWDLPGKLYQETFAAQSVDAPDERAIPWKGVRLHCDVQREQLVGLQIELDYLTVGQSNVLKLVYRIHNTTTARRHIDAGWLVFAQPDGTSDKNVLRSESVERKATPWETWSDAEHWGIVVNPDTGRTMALVSAYPQVRLIDWGDAGGHLAWMSVVDVPPLGTAERVCYLVLCSDPVQAKRYIWLGDASGQQPTER
jgi:ribosomal protein S18 acetylase RimI-like enzyme